MWRSSLLVPAKTDPVSNTDNSAFSIYDPAVHPPDFLFYVLCLFSLTKKQRKLLLKKLIP